MSTFRASLVVSVAFLTVLVSAAGIQPPGAMDQPVIHFPPLPPTLPQLAASVDAVVFGRMVSGQDPNVETDALNRENIRRYQNIEVLEFLKGASADRQKKHVVVRQAGGAVTVNGRSVAEGIVQRLLQPGDRAVLFLRNVSDRPNIYYIAYGPNGILLVEKDNMVALPPQMQRMSEFFNRDRIHVDELLNLLRAAGH